MKEEGYDVVVVGSGVGGLCSAALLAYEGYKCLLVECRSHLGGRFSTLEQEGFKLPTGAALIRRGPPMESIWKLMGAQFDIQDSPRHFCWLNGNCFELPEKGQVAGLLTILEKVGGERVKLVSRIAKEIAVAKISEAFGKSKRELPDEEISFRDWLRRYTDNEQVLQAFHVLTSALSSVNDFELPARYWFEFMSKAAERGYKLGGVATHGNLKLAESLAERIKTMGNDVWINCSAKRILVKEGAVKSISVEKDGYEVEIATKAVISSIGPKKTVELAGAENFSAEYLKEMNERIRPAPVVVTLIASDRPVVDVAGAVLFLGLRRIVAGIPLTNLCPMLAPPRKHLTVLWATPETCLHHINTVKEIEQTLLDVKEICPDLEKYGKILSIEARDIDHEFPAVRSWGGYDISQETPVKGLYNVGDAVKPYGWWAMAACAESARIVVEKLKRT